MDLPQHTPILEFPRAPSKELILALFGELPYNIVSYDTVKDLLSECGTVLQEINFKVSSFAVMKCPRGKTNYNATDYEVLKTMLNKCKEFDNNLYDFWKTFESRKNINFMLQELSQQILAFHKELCEYLESIKDSWWWKPTTIGE